MYDVWLRCVFYAARSVPTLILPPTDVLSLLLFIANKVYITYRLKVLDAVCPSMDDEK